ncbi:kinase [Sesbania bispinosa]|nr:kinase [Sesbania bispinosa]
MTILRALRLQPNAHSDHLRKREVNGGVILTHTVPLGIVDTKPIQNVPELPTRPSERWTFKAAIKEVVQSLRH